MNTRNLRSWMWGDALALLERADRLHRQFFQPSPKAAGSRPVWQPPVDVYETARELIMLIALPGVAAENVQVMFDGRVLSLVAERALPARDEALIRRLEIPYGRFERHLELTGDGLDLVQQELSNGCLAGRFAKGDRQ
jgi:HSP20 family protein